MDHIIEVKDLTKEACIINLDNNGAEISREYFGGTVQNAIKDE